MQKWQQSLQACLHHPLLPKEAFYPLVVHV